LSLGQSFTDKNPKAKVQKLANSQKNVLGSIFDSGLEEEEEKNEDLDQDEDLTLLGHTFFAQMQNDMEVHELSFRCI
jgi:hypothetical protein